jgi:hypothetical protein
MKEGEPVTVICPPKIQAMMTGAWKAEKSAHELCLFYTDGSTETVKLSDIPDNTDWQSWFAIVGAVQELRKQPA